MKINSKKIISWLLIFVIIFTGVNWPELSSFAETSKAVQDLGVTEFDADITKPYIAIVLDKNIKTEEGVSSDNVDIYAVRTSTRMYYMEDYNYLVSGEEGINFKEEIYKWDSGAKSWILSTNYTSTLHKNLGTYILFSDEDGTINEMQYITKDVFEAENFDIYSNSYDYGLYVVAYNSLNENNTLTNKNYLTYKEDENYGFVRYNDDNSLLFANLLFEENFYNYKTLVTSIDNNSSSAERDFDPNDIRVGDIIGFPAFLQLVGSDNLMGSNRGIGLDISYDIGEVAVFSKDEFGDITSKIYQKGEDGITSFAKYENKSIYIGSQMEGVTSFVEGNFDKDRTTFVDANGKTQTIPNGAAKSGKVAIGNGYFVDLDGQTPVIGYYAKKAVPQYLNNATRKGLSDVNDGTKDGKYTLNDGTIFDYYGYLDNLNTDNFVLNNYFKTPVEANGSLKDYTLLDNGLVISKDLKLFYYDSLGELKEVTTNVETLDRNGNIIVQNDGSVVSWDTTNDTFVTGYYNNKAEFIEMIGKVQHPYVNEIGGWFDLNGQYRSIGDTNGAKVGRFYVNETNNFRPVYLTPVNGYNSEFMMGDDGIITSLDGLIRYENYCLYTNYSGAGDVVNLYMKKEGRGEKFYFDDRGWYTSINGKINSDLGNGLFFDKENNSLFYYAIDTVWTEGANKSFDENGNLHFYDINGDEYIKDSNFKEYILNNQNIWMLPNGYTIQVDNTINVPSFKLGYIVCSTNWVDASFVVRVDATFKLNGNPNSLVRTKPIYLKVANNGNADVMNALNTYFDSLTKEENIKFYSTINKLVADNFDSKTYTLGTLNSSINPLGRYDKYPNLNLDKESKEINTFVIYNFLSNNYFDKDALKINEGNVSYEIVKVAGVPDDLVENKSKLNEYISFATEKDNSGKVIKNLIKIDADKITEYRRDNIKVDAFNSFDVKATYKDGNKEYTNTFTILLNISHYLNGKYPIDGGKINLANIDFASSLSGNYAPLVSELKYLDFYDAYKTIVNYSDYQLLYYTSQQPFLDTDGASLIFTSGVVDMEVYVNVDGVWQFYNYLEDVKDAKILLPTANNIVGENAEVGNAGYRAIDFVSYDLLENVGNKVVVKNTGYDSNFNIKLRYSKLPGNFVGGENIWSTMNVGELSFDTYYVFRNGNGTYFMVKSTGPVNIIEGSVSYGNYGFEKVDNSQNPDIGDGEQLEQFNNENYVVYILSQNVWVPCDMSSVLINGFIYDYETDFEKYLIYTNDTILQKEYEVSAITNDEIGSVDYFYYFPEYQVAADYNYIIAKTVNGYKAIEWKDADLKVIDGNIVFTYANGTNPNILTSTFEDFKWKDKEVYEGISSESYDNTIGGSYFAEKGIVGSIIYSSVDINTLVGKYTTDEVKVFDKEYSNSSIISSNIITSTYSCFKPTLENVSESQLKNYDVLKSQYGNYFLLKQDSSGVYYAYFLPDSTELFFNESINVTIDSKEDDLYFYWDAMEKLDVIVLKYDEDTVSWNLNKVETFEKAPEELEKYIYCASDFSYNSIEIPANNNNYTLVVPNHTFLGENSKEDLISVNETNTDGEVVGTNYFVNGEKFVNEKYENFYQLLDNPDNYFIMTVDKLSNVYDPSTNKGEAIVYDTIDFNMYAPLFINGIKVVTGKIDSKGILSYFNGKTNVNKIGDWYASALVDDEQAPIVDTIYAVGGKLKVYSIDEDEYQKTSYQTEVGNVVYFRLGANNHVYEWIPASYAKDIDSSQLLVVDGVNYIDRGEADEENGYYIGTGKDGKEENMVYFAGQKLNRRRVEGENQYTTYLASGIENNYIKLEQNGSFNDIIIAFNSEGNQVTYPANSTIPSGTVIPIPSEGIPLPMSSINVTFYSLDLMGNMSDEIKITIDATNNKVIYPKEGTSNQDILDEIQEALDKVATDDVPPEILYAYIYKGELRIGAIDKGVDGVVAGFPDAYWYNQISYTSFENGESELLEDIVIMEDDGTYRTISKLDKNGRNYQLKDLLKGSQYQWHSYIGDGLKITNNSFYYQLLKDVKGKIEAGTIEVLVRDANRNESEILKLPVSEEANNTILFGADKVPTWIRDLLDKAQSGEDVEEPLDAFPVITSIYVLNGVLYVTATDDIGIQNYGFRFNRKTTAAEDFNGKYVTYDVNGISTVHNPDDKDYEPIRLNELITSKTTYYRNENFVKINVPTAMTVYVTDTSNNTSEMTIYPTSNNQVYYGEVDGSIGDIIEGEGGTTTPPENTGVPMITSVYTYQGYLYFEGIMEDGPHSYGAFGFQPNESVIFPGTFEGFDELNREISITAGRVIDKNIRIYKDNNYQRISFPVNISVILRDAEGDEDIKTFFIDKDNTLYFGEWPGNIDEGELEDGRDDEGDDKPGTDIPPGSEDDDKEDEDGDGTPDNKDPDSDGDGKDDNIKEETEETPGIIVPDDDFVEEFDFGIYDYEVQLLDKNTERLVYSIRKDEAIAVELPKLQDSTTYIYQQLIIDEETNAVEDTFRGTYSSMDTIAPVITKIWFSNYRLFVAAYDQGGLAKEPYLFAIQGTPVTNEKYSSYNNIRAVYGDKVAITVKDAAGNTTTVTIQIKDTTENVLYQCVNPTKPVFVQTGTSKTNSYWLAYLSSKYNVDIEGLVIDEANCSNISFENTDNEVIFDFSNDGVLTYYNEKTNMYYALNLRTLNAGKSYRSIIVENGSKVDFALAFERKLIDVFGTTDGITWATDDSGIIKRNSSMVLANNPGVAMIIASKNGVKEKFYIVVGETISKVTSDCDFTQENFAFTYLVKTPIDLLKALNITEENAKYIVLDSCSEGFGKDGNTLKASTIGRKTFILLDVVKDEMIEYTFESVRVVPFISSFTDIIGAANRTDIEYLCERGVISQYPDFKYKTANKMTTKEFLTMLNRIRLTYDDDFELKKVEKEINLDIRDFDYYSSMNILSNLTQSEVNDMLSEYSLNKAITFEEVVALISNTLLYDEYHTQDGLETPEGLTDVSEAALHLMSIGIITKDEARNGTREVTKSEIAYLLAQTIRFLEY